MDPIFVIDFEASCLGPYSYPIEAGVARWDGPGHSIRTWSSLIVPEPRWIEHGDWTEQAQRIHGITPADLEKGRRPHDVVAGLRAMAAGLGRALCDGGEHDLLWLTRLTMASGWPHLPFGLDDFDEMTTSMPGPAYMGLREIFEHTPIPHRAGPDAVRMVQACVVGLTGAYAKVEVMADRDVLPDG